MTPPNENEDDLEHGGSADPEDPSHLLHDDEITTAPRHEPPVEPYEPDYEPDESGSGWGSADGDASDGDGYIEIESGGSDQTDGE